MSNKEPFIEFLFDMNYHELPMNYHKLRVNFDSVDLRFQSPSARNRWISSDLFSPRHNSNKFGSALVA